MHKGSNFLWMWFLGKLTRDILRDPGLGLKYLFDTRNQRWQFDFFSAGCLIRAGGTIWTHCGQWVTMEIFRNLHFSWGLLDIAAGHSMGPQRHSEWGSHSCSPSKGSVFPERWGWVWAPSSAAVNTTPTSSSEIILPQEKWTIVKKKLPAGVQGPQPW